MKRSESRFVRIALIAFFILAILYALYEARGALSGPVIDVPNTTVTAENEFITIQGQAERISELRMNGERIPVTEEGLFAEPYVLALGVNYIVLEARDARGRTTTETIKIVYMGEMTSPTKTPSPPASSTPQTP